MRKISLVSAIMLILSVIACGTPGTPAAGPAVPAAAQATPTSPENTIRFAYRNVSLVTPPFGSNKITAEQLELREQLNPADDVPSFIQIDIREPWDVADENGLYSQVLVYPLADLVQTYPEAGDAAVKLQGIIKQSGEPLPGQLPFWPLQYFSGVIGAQLKSYGRPVLTAQAQLLDFGNGHGIRYVTLLEQQPPRVHRMEGLIYTYQGLTNDGLYYVSVILPIDMPHEDALRHDLENRAELPVPDYAGIAQRLNALAPDQFYLRLGDCDGLIKSLAVSP